MSMQKLVMKYHPAKKEIEFHRFQNGKEVAIRNDSRLTRYINMRGKFVLQDHGDAFFDDIAKAFDGLKTVKIEVVTTKLDYADLEQMVEHYNADSASKMDPTLLAELPDMEQTFREVVKHGEDSIGILERHRQKLFEIPLENENVKISAESFARQIDGQIKSIREKIDSLGDSSVSLCFTGVYSAGKSALINAILGYRILPESIESKTAKMFQIFSPEEGKPVRICFDILNVYTELQWNDRQRCFEFMRGPSENFIREDIQRTMNEIRERGLKQHEQIETILEKLNICQEVGPSVKISFPVPLDSGNTRFTIYDTPGTDSNYLAHQRVLMDALEEQTQSILIFVAKPDGLEGAGNNALLNYIKDAEKKSSKTSIDIGRSLFVINKADAQTAEARIRLQTEEIKNKTDDTFSIKLADKKLFFTSALYACAAKAVKNGVAADQEQGLFQAGKYILAMEGCPMSYCYRQNRCATSEVATGRMLQHCESALADAEAAGDDSQIMVICSGLYALEQEIVEYGEKFASAVKAFAIIDSVDKALCRLGDEANSLREGNRDQISVIENNIRELRETITAAIETEYHNVALPVNKALPREDCRRLKIDSDSLEQDVIGYTKRRLKAKIKGWFFGYGKVRFKENDKVFVKNEIGQVLTDFTENFLRERGALLKNRRDQFMDAVKKTIEENGSISESAKKVFLDIPEPVISEQRIADLGEIYDSFKRVDKVLWFQQEHLDKSGFIEEIDKKLFSVARKMADDYSEDYRNSLETLLMQIKSTFECRLEQYSVKMRGMIEDRETMMKLRDRVEDAAEALRECQGTLNEMIWREIRDDG